MQSLPVRGVADRLVNLVGARLQDPAGCRYPFRACRDLGKPQPAVCRYSEAADRLAFIAADGRRDLAGVETRQADIRYSSLEEAEYRPVRRNCREDARLGEERPRYALLAAGRGGDACRDGRQGCRRASAPGPPRPAL